MLDHVDAGRLTLERFVDLTSAGPQRVFGIAGKGRIALGYDADFTIVDLKAKRHDRERRIASRCGWTPFDGMEATGWPVATIIRGQSSCATAGSWARRRDGRCAFWKRSELLEPEFAAIVFQLGRFDNPASSNPHRVQLAVKFGLPETEKRVQFGEFRALVVFLPDIRLKQRWMIGPTVEDLGRRQPGTIQDLR